MAGTGGVAAAAHASIDLPPVADEPSLARLETENPEYLRIYRQARLLQRENGLRDVRAHGAVRLAPSRDLAGRPVFIFEPSRLPKNANLERVIMYAVILMHETVHAKDAHYRQYLVSRVRAPMFFPEHTCRAHMPSTHVSCSHPSCFVTDP